MKMLRKSLAIIIACLMIIGCIPAVSAAGEELSFGDFTYSRDGSEITVLKYTGSDTDVVIPSEIGGFPVRHIGKYFLEKNPNVLSVVIPNTVQTIGERAFYQCENINSIKLSSRIRKIGRYAFYRTGGLKDVVLPETLIELDINAFECCESLESVKLPDSLVELPRKAFQNCSNLRSVEFGSGLQTIGEYAFNSCYNLNNVTVPSNVKTIGSYAFDDCSELTDITLSEGIETIGENVFFYCAKLESVVLPDSVTSLGGAIFEGCKALKSVKFPRGITKIPGGTFRYCSSIDRMELPETVTSIGMYAYAETSIESVCLPERITKLENSVFRGCKKLKSVVIEGDIGKIYSNTFENCNALESVELKRDVSSIGERAFYGCSSLSSVELNDGLTSIGKYCFAYCKSLKSVKIPSGITTINNETFYSCSVLENVEIPDSVTSIGSEAFAYCKSLESITLPRKLQSIGMEVFSCCTALKSIEIPDSVTLMESDTFSGCKSLESVKIGKGITEIRQDVFYGCTSLESIELPSTVSSVTAGAFSRCTSLKKVYIFNKKAALYSYSIGYSMAGNGSYVKDENPPTIYGYYQSTAETYAKNNGFEFYEFNSIPPGVQTVINLDSDVIEVDETRMKKIGFTVTNPGGSTLFESTDNSVVTVDYKGRIRGVKEGEAYIVLVNANATVLQKVVVKHSDIDYTKEQDNSEFKYSFIEDENGGLTVRINSYVGSGGKVVIPSEILSFPVKTIAGTFKNHLNITELEISEGVETMGEGALSGCDNIRKIKYPATMPLYRANISSLNNLEVFDYPDLELYLNKSNDLDPLIDHPYTLLIGGQEISRIVIPESVTKVPPCMFMNCKSIKSVVLSNTREIKYGAFMNCTSLESVRLPDDSMDAIATNAFRGCEKLGSVTLPKYVGTIGMFAFAKTLIKTINVRSSHIIYDGAFADCPKLETVYIKTREFDETLYYGLFADSPSLKEIHFDIDTPEVTSDIFYGMTASPTIYGASYSAIDRAAREYGFTFAAIDTTPTTEAPTEPATAAPTEPTLPQIPVYPDYSFNADTKTYFITDKAGAFHGGEEAYPNDHSTYAKTLIYDYESEARITSWSTQWFPLIEKVIVRGNIPEISGNAFSYVPKDTLKEVVLSDNVKVIKDYAFYGCKLLTDIPYGKNLTTIGFGAFGGCDGFKNIHIPSSVTTIGENAINGSNLKSVHFPPSVTTIGKGAFVGCSNLTEVTIPSTVTSIGEYAFGYLYNGVQKEHYPIPNFKIRTMRGTAGERYAIENEFLIEYIDEDTEYFAPVYPSDSAEAMPTAPTEYTEPTDPATDPTEPSTAQPSTPEPETEMPETEVTSAVATWVMPSVETGFTENPSDTGVPEGLVFDIDTISSTCALREYTGNAEELVIPSHYLGMPVTRIYDEVFANNQNLKRVIIPDTVLEIWAGAFENCMNLEYVKLPENLTRLSGRIFKNCIGLKSVTIPSSVTYMGYNCITGSGITDLVIPDSVTELGDYAFKDAKSLKNVTIGTGVNLMPNGVFDGCRRIENVYIKDLAKWCLTRMNDEKSNPIYYCENVYVNGELLTDLVLTDDVKAVADYTFCNYKKLRTFDMGNSRGGIGEYAFSDCVNLETVYFNDNCSGVGECAFSGCAKLRGVRFGEGFKTIGERAFVGCPELKVYVMPKSVERIAMGGIAMFGIYDGNYEAVVYGYKDTVVEEFCKRNGLTFLDIEQNPVPEGAVPKSVFDQEPTTEPITENTEPTTAEPATEPTETTTAEPTTVPTEPATAEPTTEPTEPTTAEPTTVPTEPTTAEPTTVPTEPTTAEPTTVPTEPTTVEPATEVTQPATEKPTEAVTPKKSQSVKKDNPARVTVKKKTVKAKKLKSKARKLKALAIKNARGKISFKLIKSGTSRLLRKRLTINKKGEITIRKGRYKKAVYKIKVKITVKGNSLFKPLSLTRIMRFKIT